jgi:hypothetical protein
MLPPPKISSKGPAPKETIICGTTIERFNTPMEKPWPPPTFSVKVAVRAYGTDNVTARGAPRSEKTSSAANVIKSGGPSSAIVAVRFAVAVISAV